MSVLNEPTNAHVHERPVNIQERRTHERRMTAFRPSNPARVELATTLARASWSGIWGGYLLTCGIFLVLASLVVAIAASVSSSTAALTIGSVARGGTAIWMYIAGLVSLFFGGVFGSRLGLVIDRAIAWYEGSLIWVFATITAVLLMGGGLTALAPASASAGMLTATGVWLTFVGMIIGWIVTVAGSLVGRAQARDRAAALGLAA